MSSRTIEFDAVTKRYSKYGGIATLKNLLDRVKNGQIGKRLVKAADFYALQEVSFSVSRGERVGIIGPNGAGKSTTLKLINGIAHATSGQVIVKGSVGGLIELGSGFHPDLTGRENVFLSTALQGFSKRETAKIFDRIVEVAELWRFIDMPLKRYSSGMKMRLGFAVAMIAAPDIVLLDEVLSVGDADFRKKSLVMMNEYLEGRTLIFVSHSMQQVQEICERVLVLVNGALVFDGPAAEGIQYYEGLPKGGFDARCESLTLSRNMKRGFSEAPAVEALSIEILAPIDVDTVAVAPGTLMRVRFKLGFQGLPAPVRLTVRLKRTAVGSLTETVSGREFELAAATLASGQLDMAFETAGLTDGEYVLEVTPELLKHPHKMAVVVSRKRFAIGAFASPSSALGMIDLNFRLGE